MNDINFFSAPIEAAKKSQKKKLIALLLIVVFIGIIGGLYYITLMETRAIEDEIVDLNEYSQSPVLNQRLEEIREKKSELDLLNKYYNAAVSILDDIEKSNIIKNEMLETINSTLPEDVRLNNLTYTPISVTFDGVAGNRVEIAELYRNLIDLDLFSEVVIGAINEQEIMADEIVTGVEYTFDMHCIMKGGVQQ